MFGFIQLSLDLALMSVHPCNIGLKPQCTITKENDWKEEHVNCHKPDSLCASSLLSLAAKPFKLLL